MPETRELERQLRLATRTGKYIVGRKEVLRSLKGSKMLVWSASANIPPEILDQSRAAGIPTLRYEGNPIQLGRACGIPFKVSVIAIKSPGDADFSAFKAAQDYSPSQSFLSPSPSSFGSTTPIATSIEPRLTGQGTAATLEPEEVISSTVQPTRSVTEKTKEIKVETGKETIAEGKEAPKTTERKKRKKKRADASSEKDEEEEEGEKEEAKEERSLEPSEKGEVAAEEEEDDGVAGEKETAGKGKKGSKKSKIAEKKKKKASASNGKTSKSPKD